MASTEQLIKAVQEGQMQAFSELVDQHKNLVYSLVMRMVKNSQDAEEVAQDTFVKAFKSIKQFKGESKFSTWLYKIAYFTAINHLREKQLLSSNLDLTDIESEDTTALEQLNQEDRITYLHQAIGYLRPIDRNLVSLYYLDELSIKEIQEITLFTESNIKVRLLRIRKQLNGILKALLNDELQSLRKN